MGDCGPSVSSSFGRAFFEPWPLEHALRAFIHGPKHLPPRPTKPQLKASSTAFLVTPPSPHAVAASYTLAIFIIIVSFIVVLVWKARRPPPPREPVVGALSEATVLLVHDRLSRQPYHMPPDDGDDPSSIPWLPYSKEPRKQSLFLFLLLIVLVAAAIAYLFGPSWPSAVAVASAWVADQYDPLATFLALAIGLMLFLISDKMHEIVCWCILVLMTTIQWMNWTAIGIKAPAGLALAAHSQGTRLLHYAAHWVLEVPANQELPWPVDRLITVYTLLMSAACCSQLINSHVARIYTVHLKTAVHALQKLTGLYTTLRASQVFPANQFQKWAWRAIKGLLRFTLRDFSWSSISWPRLFIMLAPTFAYRIYKYYYPAITPRTWLQVALDPIQAKLYHQSAELAQIKQLQSAGLAEMRQQQSAELAEMKLILQSLDTRLAGFVQRQAGADMHVP